jgi:hypothetical protein
MIDWKKYCVWVEAADVNRVDEILLDFHHSISEDDFAQLQINIRKLWEEWISPKAFYAKFDHHLEYMQQKAAVEHNSNHILAV